MQFLFPIVLLARRDKPKAWILISIPCQKLQNFLILTLCPAQNYGCLNLQGYQITRSPPHHYPRRRGVLQTSSDRDDQRIFNSGIFGGIQNNLKFRGQCPRTVRPPSPINCFYFSCYFNAFWKFLRFRNSA